MSNNSNSTPDYGRVLQSITDGPTNRESNQSNPPTNQTVILSMKDVIHRTSLCRATILRLVKKSDFPEPVKITAGHYWLADDIQKWIMSRPIDPTTLPRHRRN